MPPALAFSEKCHWIIYFGKSYDRSVKVGLKGHDRIEKLNRFDLNKKSTQKWKKDLVEMEKSSKCFRGAWVPGLVVILMR